MNPKLMPSNNSACIANTTNLAEVTVNQNEYEENVFFRVIKDIQGLDIIVSLKAFGCYTLPYRSMFHAINFNDVFKTIAEGRTTFKEIRRERKFKKNFGFYAYKILELCVRKDNYSL